MSWTAKKANTSPQSAYIPGQLNNNKETVTIKCRVKENAQENRIYTNIAWISKYYNVYSFWINSCNV